MSFESISKVKEIAVVMPTAACLTAGWKFYRIMNQGGAWSHAVARLTGRGGAEPTEGELRMIGRLWAECGGSGIDQYEPGSKHIDLFFELAAAPKKAQAAPSKPSKPSISLSQAVVLAGSSLPEKFHTPMTKPLIGELLRRDDFDSFTFGIGSGLTIDDVNFLFETCRRIKAQYAIECD
jgi:hypothetical protein